MYYMLAHEWWPLVKEYCFPADVSQPTTVSVKCPNGQGTQTLVVSQAGF